ncbi:hypothetical protein H072_11514 [Dactylellina haptotyla CBS 200.50]|uniref:Uncharacterized protein n=1 Tax=Dactylellina haptotyla (strain CBS 200.50) TaxID=1284197 RepID=S8A203_DACHA|nr:hypothetical protein H072_11514 [Dactylellina haptotyla CBS 200.50]
MSCLPLACFGTLFQRRKKRELSISGPLETAPGPRLSQLPIDAQPSVQSPTGSSFGSSLRSPGLHRPLGPNSPAFPPPIYNTSTVNRRPGRSRNPSISVNTPARSEFRVPRTPHTPNLFTTDELRFSDEKSRDFPNSPPMIDLDTTPRIHKIFRLLSPPASKVTFTQAVREPAKPAKQTNENILHRVSKRLSRWGSSHQNRSYTNLASPPAMAEKSHLYPEQPPIPKKYIPIPEPLPTPSPPPPALLPAPPRAAKNGLGLTTRPGGQTKPVVMVPHLTLAVPSNPSLRNRDATPIEASPVCDPWRHTTAEIEGLSDRHQAWML